jgi:hypothetical protein
VLRVLVFVGREGLGRTSENSRGMRVVGFFLNLLGGMTAVAAGVFLLAHNSESGPTWLDVIAHGSGVFFIGVGVFMVGQSFLAASDR